MDNDSARHNSVDLTVPNVLHSWVQIPDIPTTLFRFTVFVITL